MNGCSDTLQLFSIICRIYSYEIIYRIIFFEELIMELSLRKPCCNRFLYDKFVNLFLVSLLYLLFRDKVNPVK